jgi:hypothetical protein
MAIVGPAITGSCLVGGAAHRICTTFSEVFRLNDEVQSDGGIYVRRCLHGWLTSG